MKTYQPIKHLLVNQIYQKSHKFKHENLINSVLSVIKDEGQVQNFDTDNHKDNEFSDNSVLILL